MYKRAWQIQRSLQCIFHLLKWNVHDHCCKLLWEYLSINFPHKRFPWDFPFLQKKPLTVSKLAAPTGRSATAAIFIIWKAWGTNAVERGQAHMLGHHQQTIHSTMLLQEGPTLEGLAEGIHRSWAQLWGVALFLARGAWTLRGDSTGADPINAQKKRLLWCLGGKLSHSELPLTTFLSTPAS